MANDTIQVGIDFKLESEEARQLLDAQARDLGQSFSAVMGDIDAIARSLQDITGPMRELVDGAKQFSDALESVKKLSEDIKNNMASTRLQGGGGMGGGGMAALIGSSGGGLSGIGGAVGGLAGGPLGALVGGAAPGLAAGAIGVGATIGSSLSDLWNSWRRGESAQQRREARTQQELSGGTLGDVLRLATEGGRTPTEILGAMDASQRAAVLGGAMGVARGIGQGPIGMFSQAVGGMTGGREGARIAEGMGLGGVGQQVGGAIGSSLFPGMFQNFIQQSMQMYPQYLQTMASQASVGQYGGSIRDIRRLNPTSFGYAPGEIGGALSGLFQGFGGGELTLETQRTAMAYSRAYGVDMGAIGQSMGGLLNMGGGGQNFGAGVRESTMAQVMTDAVAEGFGRRLPEYAQAVSAGMQTVMQGPSLVGQDAMPGLIRTMSSLTGKVATTHGLGLQGAQRMLSPLAQAPQDMIEAMMGGGGDPFRNAMIYSSNAERFGNDPWEMLTGKGGLMEASQNPFSQQALEFQRRPIEQILQGSPNNLTAMMDLRRLMPNITAQGAAQVINRGRSIMSEQGTLEGADMLELFTGVEEAQVSEGEQTRSLMEEIQQSGEDIMKEQLGAMRASAGFQAQQLAVAAAGAERAKQFYDIQLNYAKISAIGISASAAGQSIELLAKMNSPEFVQQLGGLNNQQRIEAIMRRNIDFALNMGADDRQGAMAGASIQQDILRSTPAGPLRDAVTVEMKRAMSQAIAGVTSGASMAHNKQTVVN